MLAPKVQGSLRLVDLRLGADVLGSFQGQLDRRRRAARVAGRFGNIHRRTARPRGGVLGGDYPLTGQVDCSPTSSSTRSSPPACTQRAHRPQPGRRPVHALRLAPAARAWPSTPTFSCRAELSIRDAGKRWAGAASISQRRSARDASHAARRGLPISTSAASRDSGRPRAGFARRRRSQFAFARRLRARPGRQRPGAGGRIDHRHAFRSADHRPRASGKRVVSLRRFPRGTEPN